MIKSEAACRKWQEERRAFFLERIGGHDPGWSHRHRALDRDDCLADFRWLLARCDPDGQQRKIRPDDNSLD